MNITSRRRELIVSGGYKDWATINQAETIQPLNTLVVVIDPWNQASNFDSIVPNVEAFISSMRSQGAVICFSPYDTELYNHHPCRDRVRNSIAGLTGPLPPRTDIRNIPRPVKVPNGEGRENETYLSILGRKISTLSVAKDHSIHSGLTVNDTADIIAFTVSDCIRYFQFLGRPLQNILFCGKHLNWCIMNRPNGVEEWRRRGFLNLYVKRDSTISTNIPDSPPYCSQEEIDQLHLRYVESYWAKTF